MPVRDTGRKTPTPRNWSRRVSTSSCPPAKADAHSGAKLSDLKDKIVAKRNLATADAPDEV